jgi:hypothetical protein
MKQENAEKRDAKIRNAHRHSSFSASLFVADITALNQSYEMTIVTPYRLFRLCWLGGYKATDHYNWLGKKPLALALHQHASRNTTFQFTRDGCASNPSVMINIMAGAFHHSLLRSVGKAFIRRTLVQFQLFVHPIRH